MRLRTAWVGAIAAASVACGGSTPAAPTSPSGSLPAADVCGATAGAKSSAFVVNGSDCSTANTSVVLLNLRDSAGGAYAACSAAVISPRALLTAAHCLVGQVGIVQIFLGQGAQRVASSFTALPGYQQNDPNALDVGIVQLDQDIGRPAVPLLLSRDARVGETAIVAGWGKDQNRAADTLRAAATTVSAVGPTFLQTQFASGSGAICSGDSGGPLLLNDNGVWAIGGVISAVSNAACTSGTDYYANVRNAAITAFVLGAVPDAARR